MTGAPRPGDTESGTPQHEPGEKRPPILRRAIDQCFTLALVVGLLGELCIVFLNIITRSFFDAPLIWAEEAARMALVGIAFLGGVFAYRRREHATIRLLTDALPPAAQRVCAVAVEFLVLAVAITAGWNAVPYFVSQWEELTPVLQLHASWFVLPLILAMGALAETAVERLLSQHRPTVLAVGAVAAALVLVLIPTRDVWLAWFAGDAALSVALGIFFVTVLAGLPVAFALLIGALSYLYVCGTVPMTALAQTMLLGTGSFVLLALPFFIFAAIIMNQGGISLRLVRFVLAFVGHFRGGLYQVLVVSMYIVSGLSGAKVADVAAVGSVMRDMLRREGYSLDRATAVLAASAVMGETVPPSIAMLVLGSVTTISIGTLFVAGLIPAAVIGLCLMVLVYVQSWRAGDRQMPRATWRQLVTAALGGVFPLLMPVILLGGILLGIATPTEVSSFAVVYGLVLAALVYREIGPREFLRGAVDCATSSGMILFILAAGSSFAWALTIAHLPQRLVEVLRGAHHSQTLFMVASILLLAVTGTILEGLPALLILAPLLLPIAQGVGINELHFGIVLVIAMGIGAFIPPVGVGFYVTCAICETTLERAARAMIPYVVVLFVGVVIVALVPWFTLFLPMKLHLIR
ncbi:MAG TPA: TRAP transporter large permease subunit [Candidatus Sulfotelmatobacter sp.]|nr:TRAP transporter large permease subunit [Candidatus Sulfotelmatobacter sp.]